MGNKEECVELGGAYVGQQFVEASAQEEACDVVEDGGMTLCREPDV